MIDIASEKPIRLSEVPDLQCVARRRDKPIAISTVFRWAQSGIKGVRLETISAGGALCTSVPAIQRFFEALSRTTNADKPRTPGEANRAHRLAEKRLAALGI